MGNQIKKAGGEIAYRNSGIPTGVIKPKTALDEFEHNRPNKEKEGMQAMKDTLDNTELKDLADKVKKQNERL